MAAENIVGELAPTGALRAGINLSNGLLVTGTAENGDPVGVSPDLAAEIARRLGVGVRYLTYPGPGDLVAAVDEWDIGNVGANPQRAERIAFTGAYCEIEATYLVRADSPVGEIADVDCEGIRVVVKGTAAYGLWLDANLRHARLMTTETKDESLQVFLDLDTVDAVAGLRPWLAENTAGMEGLRLLDGQFTAVQQAVGTPKDRDSAAAWLHAQVEDMKASGFIAELIAKHGVEGLSVAPPAQQD